VDQCWYSEPFPKGVAFFQVFFTREGILRSPHAKQSAAAAWCTRNVVIVSLVE